MKPEEKLILSYNYIVGKVGNSEGYLVEKTEECGCTECDSPYWNDHPCTVYRGVVTNLNLEPHEILNQAVWGETEELYEVRFTNLPKNYYKLGAKKELMIHVSLCVADNCKECEEISKEKDMFGESFSDLVDSIVNKDRNPSYTCCEDVYLRKRIENS